VIKSNGDIYFTDPPYGLRGTNESPLKELDFNGVYRIDGQDSTVSLFFRDMTRPNGIALSPDEKTLYVANSDPGRAIWMVFELDEAGGLISARTFFNATNWVEEGRKGLPDGMTVDHQGNLFVTGPGGVIVFTPDGEHLGTIETGQATANCTFGGPDGSILFITADMYFCKIQTTTSGVGF
jgi:gluconolactonase